MQAKNQEFEAMVGESMIKTQEVEAQASNRSQLTKTHADNLSEVTSPTVLEKAFDDYQEIEMKKEVAQIFLQLRIDGKKINKKISLNRSG